MQPLSVVAFASYLPETEVGLEFFYGEQDAEQPLAESPMFKAPASRRHIARDERAAAMIDRAARALFDRLGLEAEGNVDILITNVLLPDFGLTGSGAEAAALLGCAPEWILDLHNGGCASFVYMLKLARSIMQGGSARSALLCNVQNCAGQVFTQSQVRKYAHAAIPGDGCGVAYVTAGERSPVVAIETRNHPEFATDMGLSAPDGRKYWEPGSGQVDVRFNAAKAVEIIQRGNTLVPAVVSDLCASIDVKPSDIDVLVTNQPTASSCATGRRRSSRDGTSTPSTSSATCSGPACRSHSTTRSARASARRGPRRARRLRPRGRLRRGRRHPLAGSPRGNLNGGAGPLRPPPVAVAEQGDQRGHQQAAHHGHVEDHRDAHAHSQLREGEQRGGGEGEEDHAHRQPGESDRASRRDHSTPEARDVGASAPVLLADARQEKHLVVGREAEHHRDQRQRHEEAQAAFAPIQERQQAEGGLR